jgi:hypothetical protein
MFYMSFQVTEPDVDPGDVDGDFIAHGELVQPGGHRPVLSELVDAALHGLTLLAKLRVAPGWPAAVGSLLTPVSGLVLLSGMVALIPRRRR